MVLAVPVPLQLPEDVLGCGGTVRLAGLLPPRRHKHRDLLQGLTEVSGSVVDPNTLKLDPSWISAQFGSGSRVMLSILKEKFKNNFGEKTVFLRKKVTVRNVSWVPEWSSILHLLPLIYPIFACLDPDTFSECGSKSTKVLTTDSIWIRIHNTVKKYSFYFSPGFDPSWVPPKYNLFFPPRILTWRQGSTTIL